MDGGMKVCDWQSEKRWSDKFLPEIKSILGVHLIGEPPHKEDAERNTDLMVMRMDAVRIGCRVRRFQYLDRYSDEFTIRAGLASGAKTELTKVIEGWGDYFFYAFANAEETGLAYWTLADMRVFRRTYARMLAASNAGVFPGIGKDNTDGRTRFAAFKWAQFPREFVVGQSPVAVRGAA
jgi:hypothetical protein